MTIGLFAARAFVDARESLRIAQAVAFGSGNIEVEDMAETFRLAGASQRSITRAVAKAWHSKNKGT